MELEVIRERQEILNSSDPNNVTNDSKLASDSRENTKILVKGDNVTIDTPEVINSSQDLQGSIAA